MRVLLGIGGTEDSYVALERTLERTAETGDELTVALLENPAVDLTHDELEDGVRSALADHQLEATVRRLEGDPGPRLVEVAGEEGFDRIVLGGGQRSPMGKINVGSVGEFVVLNADTSVTLIR